eukprot:gene10184-13702_t
MHAGYLNKRNSPISPPGMQKVYSVLWGSLMFDFENEEEAKNSMCPKIVTEILGVSEWDGKGRANHYPFGFLLVTHTGATYYVSVTSITERDEWILHVKRALECVFANPTVAPFKPSKIIQNRPPYSTNLRCPKSHVVLNSSNVIYCKSCGRGYGSNEYVTDLSSMLQIGQETLEKVCSDCKNAQMAILWFKALNYVHLMNLHEFTPIVQKEVNKFKASFKLRLRTSQRLEMAACLLEDNNLTLDEFDELRQVDHAFRRELIHEESMRLKVAVDLFGEDMQTIIGILMNPSLTEKGGRNSYYVVILRILEIADNGPDLIDFYFPQIIQVHLQEARSRLTESLVKIDLLQQALLVISQKYPALGLKLAWCLIGSINDYNEKPPRINQTQYAACLCLLMQLEMVVTGIVSSIADVKTCKLLASVFQGAIHQQQEVGYEISVLFLIRRRLQEIYDEEESQRKSKTGIYKRKSFKSPPPSRASNLNDDGNGGDNDYDTALSSNIDLTSSKDDYNVGGNYGSESSKMVANEFESKVVYASSSLSTEATCLQLLNQLGVGPAGNSNNNNDSSNNSKSNSKASSSQNLQNLNDHKSNVFNKPLHWSGFSEQLDFINRLNDLVDSLRQVDRPLRREVLVKEIDKWNENPLKYLGWDPTTIAGEPHYRITKIITEECRVFRTKARAPSLIVCEVVRDDLLSSHFHNIDHYHHIFSGRKHLFAGTTDNQTNETVENSSKFNSTSVDVRVETKITPSNSTKSNLINLSPPQSKPAIISRRTYSGDAASAMERLSFSEKDNIWMIAANSSTEKTIEIGGFKETLLSSDSFELVTKNIKNVDRLIEDTLPQMLAEKKKSYKNDVSGAVGIADRDDVDDDNSNSSKFDDETTKASDNDNNNSNISHKLKSKGDENNKNNNSNPLMKLNFQQFVMPRKKTSSFLSSNRLSSKAEEIMKAASLFPSTSGHNNNQTPPSQGGSSLVGINKTRKTTSANNSSTDLTKLDLSNHNNLNQNQNSPRRLEEVEFHISQNQNGDFSDQESVGNRDGSDGNERSTVSSLDDGNTNQPYSTPLSVLSMSRMLPSINIGHSGSNSPHGSKDNLLNFHTTSMAIVNNNSNSTSPLGNQKVLSSAQRLLQSGMISKEEYEQLVISDLQFIDETIREETMKSKSKLELIFGELWNNKKEKYLGDKLDNHQHFVIMNGNSSNNDDNMNVSNRNSDAIIESWPAWDLRCFIVKSNDDLRQEVCCLQLMQLCKEIFEHFQLSSLLFLKPYRIINTSNST